MKRYAVTLAYNGKNYFGWQRQPKQISVQEVIENALTRLNRNQQVEVVGCGRTDTGVHAAHYVLHVDFNDIEDPQQLTYKLNKMLPDDIVIFKIEEVSPDFHARFDAKSRTYRYFSHTRKDCFNYEQSLYLNLPVDFEKMNEAAQYFLGRQDFTSLSKLHTDVKTNICEVTQAKWFQKSETEFYFEITADRFLRNMVRATVGTLLDVGTGKLSPDAILSILEAKDRGKASSSVPGHALFLWEIVY